MRNKRLGETNVNRQGMLMQIVEYHNSKDIVVKFVSTGERKRTRYSHFKSGYVASKLTAPQIAIAIVKKRTKEWLAFVAVAAAIVAIAYMFFK